MQGRSVNKLPDGWTDQHVVARPFEDHIVGEIHHYVGDDHPCLMRLDGREISREEYPELWDLASERLDCSEYGPGDGCSTFSIPDRRVLTSVILKSWLNACGVAAMKKLDELGLK